MAQPDLASPPESSQAATGTPLHRLLYFWVIIAILLGGLLGYVYPEAGVALQPLGDAFIKLVRMIIAPVIFLTVSTGIAGMNNLEKVGRIGAKTLGYFLVFSTLALIVGLVVGNIVQPGAGMNVDINTLDPKALEQVKTYAGNHDLTVIGFIMNIIPTTVVDAFAKGDILQVLLFAVLFGIALSSLGPVGRPVTEFLQLTSLAVFRVVNIIMKAAPVGAFGAMAFTIGKFGIKALLNLGMLVGTFYLTAIVFVVGVLGIVAALNGFSIFKLLRYIRAELALVLGTSSSESALPSLIEKMEKAGLDKSVVGLVIPTGYSFNLDGTNIYMTLAVLFLAQATGTHLSLSDQLVVLAVAMLSSKGAAGITGAGFITLAATLSVVPSVPVAAMAIILGIDRFMSECRALTNFAGNAVACIVIARWEKACDMDRLRAALDGQVE